MSFQQFLHQISTIYNINLRPDQFGVCQVSLQEENLSLLFEYDDNVVPQTVLLSTPLGEILAEKEEKVLKAILENNHEGENILSVDGVTPTCFLHRRFSPTMEKEQLQEDLRSFTQAAQEWRTRIQKSEEQSEQKQPIFHHQKV